MTRHWSDQCHMAMKWKKSGICVKSLYSLLHRKSKLHNENKLLLYKTVIRLILMYVSSVWGTCADTHIKKIHVTQNRLLKMCFALPRTFPTHVLHEMFKVEPVKVFIARSHQKWFANCSISDNTLISSLSPWFSKCGMAVVLSNASPFSYGNDH